MSLIYVKSPIGIRIPVSVSALQRRLIASSPLLVLLQQELEQASNPAVDLEILNELPPHLVGSSTSIEALTLLVENLGSEDDDGVMLKRLEDTMSVGLGVHMYVIADWMLAMPVTQRLAAWFCQMWLRNSESVLAGLCGVDGFMIQLAVRSHLFSSASISLTRLGESAMTKLTQAQADVDSMLTSIEQRTSEISVLKSLKSALAAEGAEADRLPVELSFPIFVSFQGHTTVVPGCTAMTSAQDIKESMAVRTGVPESIQRIDFKGKPLPDLAPLTSVGVRRDSTLNVALSPGARPKLVPRMVRVKGLRSQDQDNLWSCAACNDDTCQTILRKLKLDGILSFNGRVLPPELPLCLLGLKNDSYLLLLPKAPFDRFERRVRRRIAD